MEGEILRSEALTNQPWLTNRFRATREFLGTRSLTGRSGSTRSPSGSAST